MSTSFVVTVAGALTAVVLLGLLVRRTLSAPRPDLIALLCAGAGITVALAAQAIGYSKGFNPISFRVVQLGARLLAPIALVWALAEMTGKNFGARFAARLALGALFVVVSVILASDPLAGGAFTHNWPAPRVYYQIIPNAALDLTAAVTALAAVAAVVVAAFRARHSPAWRDLVLAIGAAAGATLAADALRVRLPANSAYAAVCVIAMALTWYAGWRSSTVSLTALHGGPGPGWSGQSDDYGSYGRDTGYQGYPPAEDDAGYQEYPPIGDDPGYREYPPAAGGGAGYQQYPPAAGGDGDDPSFDDWFRDSPSPSGYGQEPFGQESPGFGEESPVPQRSGRHSAPFFDTGEMLPVPDAYPPPGIEEALHGADASRLYGQIAIYTLLDGCEQDFDELADQVVEKVKTREPDTLVYVMHGVPSAPMQRILYAAYRDEAAYAEHSRQAYIRDFEEARKSYVLATNVIELGVQHALFPGPAEPPPPGRGAQYQSWEDGPR